MAKKPTPSKTKSAKASKDPFAAIRRARTSAPNFDLDTDGIIGRLKQWESLCSFKVVEAGGDTVGIEFTKLPKDMDAFVREIYDFCPDIVDQGTGCAADILEMEETGADLAPEMKKLIAQIKKLSKGVDLSKKDSGMELLKRQLEQDKGIGLWWD